jgi:non-ribosomal peptide synthetase component F
MQMNPTQLNFWQDYLENAPAMLTLPIDKQRLAGVTPQTAVHHITLPTEILPTKAASTTHFLAAYTLLLLRHSQQDDMVVGTAVDNHLLPLRAKITTDTTFAQLVQQLTQAQQQAKNNALPLAALVEGLQPARDDSYAPLFQVAFAAGDWPETANNSLYDLTLMVKQAADGWQSCWHYRADLFTEPHIQQFAAHFETLLRAAADNPDCPVKEMAMIPAAERELLLHTWNQTALEVPRDLGLHEWIAQQAAKTPERTAVSDTTSYLTYAELDRQSSQLASYLQQHGVMPGVVVALSLERTVKVLVALLGILKAGGTYLTLIPNSPPHKSPPKTDSAVSPTVPYAQSHASAPSPATSHTKKDAAPTNCPDPHCIRR